MQYALSIPSWIMQMEYHFNKIVFAMSKKLKFSVENSSYHECKFHLFFSRFTSKTFMGLRKGNFGLKKKVFKKYFLPILRCSCDDLNIWNIHIVFFLSKKCQTFFVLFQRFFFSSILYCTFFWFIPRWCDFFFFESNTIYNFSIDLFHNYDVCKT